MFLLLLLVLVGALAIFFKIRYSRFKDYGVNHLPPIPPFGNSLTTIVRKHHLSKFYNKLYESFPEDRFVGLYDWVNPVIVLKDLELIKKVCVKDFESFVDHRVKINENTDTLFSRNLFALKGNKWRKMRSILSPTFTSSKMRQMVPLMTEVADQMVSAVKKKMEKNNENKLELEMRDFSSRFTTDIIATCAFGVKVNSYDEENNEFFLNGRQTLNFGYAMLLKFFAFTVFPKLMNFLKVTLFPIATEKFFRNLIMNVVKDREENKIVRPDMIHLLMQMKKGQMTQEEKKDTKDTGFATVEESDVGGQVKNIVWTDNDMIAQGLQFFFAGFETSSVINFTLYELAVNPDIQDKLMEEIRKVQPDITKPADFDTIQKMKYLDMIVSEGLRKWTPVVFIDRICTANYNLGKPNKNATKDYIIRKGDGVVVPVRAIHHDPNHYPDPYKFRPERFSEENCHNINPFSYSPFGIGPRNCIASRFALCFMKVMIYNLIKNIRISPYEKTSIPPVLSPNHINLRPEGGLWLRMEPRTY